MLRLHYAPGTISIAIAIALHEAGLAFEAVAVDFAAGEQRGDAYARLNPKGRVPALATDSGVLTETGAILEYVAALAPDAGLMPADPFDAARMRETMYYLASTFHVNHAHKMRGHRWADSAASHEDMRAKVPQTMAAAAAHVDSRIAGPFLLGDTPCIADPYLFVASTWLAGDGVRIRDHPALAAHFAAMISRPATRRVVADGMLPGLDAT